MKTLSTKRALFASVISLLLCVTMLIGSTFAWFTDTATASVNTIQSGSLKLDIVDKDGASLQDQGMKFLNDEGSDDILWEPGATFRTAGFRIKNIGNLSLKFKLALTGLNGTSELLKVIEFSVVREDGTSVDLSSFEGTLLAADAESELLFIEGHMKETAGNEYQGKTLDGIGITVYATQYTYEYDSNGNTYDTDAAYPTYPAGLTKDDFAAADKAVDDEGNFYPTFKEALENVADNGTLYFKEESIVDFPTHLNVTKNVTIYANGADFSGKDISIGTYAAPENEVTTVNIYGAKNLVVWGQPTTGLSDACTWNINFYNCENDGYNFLMYRGGSSATAKINLTLTGCKANGFADSIVHTTADGSILIKDCTFTNNCAPINIAHKQSGTMSVTVENTAFIGCGKVDPANDYFAPARFVNNSETGTLTVNLLNNSFTDTIGTNGDILLGDYREGKASHKVTANIVTNGDTVTVKSSADTAYEYAGGTVIAGVPAISTEATGTTMGDVFKDEDGNSADFGFNTPAKDLTIDGKGTATVTGFADAWIEGDVTIKGVTFKNGACFTAKADGTVGTLTLENCTFYACNQDLIDLTPYAVNSLKNSGAGLCLNIDTKNSPNLKIVIKGCKFVGENDKTLDRNGWKDMGGEGWNKETATKDKSRGHAIMINGICGGGDGATAESVLIENCTMNGIRGHAIQLYALRFNVTIRNCKINSWGNNAQTAGGKATDAAIRGDLDATNPGSLTLENNYFGLDETSNIKHVNVDRYTGNTDGTRKAGTYN